MMKVTKLLTLTLFLLLVITGCESTADTSFTVAITNSDPLVNGKDAVTVIRFANINAPYITLRGVFSSNIITKKVQVPDSYFINGKAEVVITSFLFDYPEDEGIEPEVYKSIPSAFMWDKNFTEAYGSTKSIKMEFVLKQNDSQYFQIDFPDSLNITMKHNNFSTNSPIVSWAPYPGVSGYYEVAILVMAKDDVYSPDWIIGNTSWMIAFKEYAIDTSIQIYSDLVHFVDGYASAGITIPPYLKSGDVFRVEVYAFDNRQRFVDSLTIRVNRQEDF